MKTVHRYDVGGLEKPVVTPAGFLRVDGYLTRAGVFTYRNPDGSLRRELRHEDEVFKQDSVSSFALAPVTDDHPPSNLTAENAKDYQRGAVTENIHQDGDYLRASMLITDAELRDKMMAGRKNQISLGYTCDVEDGPGVWRGQKYDAVQKNIRGNHVAVVEFGRAGAGARVRMDAEDAEMIFDPTVPPASQEQTVTLKTFRHDGVSFEAPEQVVELVSKLQKERSDAVKDLDSAKSDAQKRIDSAEAAKDQAITELKQVKADAAVLPATLRKEIAARMDLEARARGLLGKNEKLDGKTDREVRVAVLKKLQPKLDIAAKSDDYVAARFDVALEAAKQDTTEDLKAVRQVTEEHQDEEERDDEAARFDHEAAAVRNKKAMSDLWKQPL